MKAKVQVNELRIGSYYEYDKGTVKLDGSLLAMYLQNDTDLYLYPIPLTEEWLIKFGFGNPKNFTKGLWLETDIIGIEKGFLQNEVKMNLKYNNFNIELWDYVCQFKIKCDYVHQLQNLYHALTGTELKPTSTSK
jgi:hypothetical protein